MILIDSSSWVHFFHGSPTEVADAIGEWIVNDSAACCGPVVTEILSGAENHEDFAKLRKHFSLLPFLDLEPGDYYRAGELRNRLKGKKIKAKTVDVLIAGLAVRHKIPLLTHDADFKRIARYCSLSLHPLSFT